MGVSRRSVIVTSIAASAAAAVPIALNAGVSAAASAPGDVVGKITVGYQGWFAAPGDGAPINGWWHYSPDWSQPPAPGACSITCWPDMRDFTKGYRTNFANLGNGQPANLFSSYDQQTVDTHFRWMQQNGCDTAALQRFNPNGGEGATRDAMAQKVRQAAEAYGRKFYIMYDVTWWLTMQNEIKADWANKMSAHAASAAYARQNGKPVVCIWGFGFNDDGRPFAPAACLDVINWFKGQGCYVIGGVPTHWRLGTDDSRAGFIDVYHAFDMVSPWMVGRISDNAGADWYYQNRVLGDLADLNARGIDYQPCVIPGDLAAGHRRHGELMWRQFYNHTRAGVKSAYISMFDEFNEGNQIAKTAESAAWQPTNSGMRALDEDGTPCSSDYYLRLTNDGGRMLKGQIALTEARFTAPFPTGPDQSAPSVPGSLRVTGTTDTTVALAWNAATDNVGVAGYRISRVAGATSSVVGTTTTLAFTATGLSASTGYTFTVAAFDAAGNASGASNAVTATTTAPPSGSTNLAAGRPTAESSHTQTYGSGNAVDGNTGTYWESANNAWPQWLQVDLGSAVATRRIVLTLPPQSSWATRTQTVAVSGSTNGSSFTGIVGAQGYTFDPASGNTVTITFPATVTTRYLRLTFTANTGWPAGQVSELRVYSA
ncbi:discoidin domain-containing protein [Dactylosporangium vinaceum]|uniref:Discoidin domain-containing protein n=1 Tax=Dactylosporangium vinaceum TaxID=53362 RepID=A0ABV5MFS6_9ACTN|nr:discoidin domain-containing protein [Dactylosporangium vinaceum]UAB98800.1 discoidin domain-containing protein [Dactylosporangium vinaceum]